MKEKLIERVINLLTIKSLVTLQLTAVFCYLSVIGTVSPEIFMTVFVVVIGFYYGTQKVKENVQ
jgi:hypothetical protein